MRRFASTNKSFARQREKHGRQTVSKQRHDKGAQQNDLAIEEPEPPTGSEA
jgi:hypothetical protein